MENTSPECRSPGPSVAVSVDRCRPPRRRRGFSIIELLVVIAILGVLLGIGFVNLRPPSARLAANSFKGLLHEARNEAIKRNRPVSVVWDATASAMIVGATPSMISVDCSTGVAELGRLEMADYRGVAVVTDMPGSGVLWLPNGRHRACVPAGALGSTTTFSSGDVALDVTISIGGSVAIQ